MCTNLVNIHYYLQKKIKQTWIIQIRLSTFNKLAQSQLLTLFKIIKLACGTDDILGLVTWYFIKTCYVAIGLVCSKHIYGTLKQDVIVTDGSNNVSWKVLWVYCRIEPDITTTKCYLWKLYENLSYAIPHDDLWMVLLTLRPIC